MRKSGIGHVSDNKLLRNGYKICAGKPHGKRPFERHRLMQEAYQT
jgi:hypothetical protein